jgi:hypothetical protein
MRTIVNKTGLPVRVPLPGGKVLHLGPKKSGQVADAAADHAGLRKLVDAGTIELQGEGDNSVGDGMGSNESGHGNAQGMAKSPIHRRGGQRGS